MGLAEKADVILIDHAVAAMAVGITGANKTDYHVKNVVPGRDFALEGKNIKVVDIRNAVEGDMFNGKGLLFRRGIEVGQVFKLGIKYSAKLNAKFLDAAGNEKPCLMGCYGIGINRILASAIEISHDDKGPILPITIAPWEVIITPAGTGDAITEAAEKIHTQLNEKSVEVLFDDRPDIRAGVKFNDADLLGIPIRVTVGQKSLAAGKVEIKLRSESKSKKVDVASAANEVAHLVNSLKANLNTLD
jgi:prolyl-tRNA synthetase